MLPRQLSPFAVVALLATTPALMAPSCDDEPSTDGSTHNTALDAGSDAADVAADTADDVGAVADTEPDQGDAAVDVDPGPPGQEVAFQASQAYLARQAEYLAFCGGGLYGQSCRVARGESDLDDGAIDAAIAHLGERRDTADFRANGLVRLLYLDNDTGALGDDRRAAIEQSLLDFKYWLDEPGEDGMAYWTENHQILFHTAELLIGQRFPETEFSNSGMTGQDHIDHAIPRLHRWLDLRARYGFSEWHSNVYFNEDIPALLNLVDFAADESLRQKATLVLDVVALDLLHNTFDGAFATTAGRTYSGKFIGGANDSTQEVAWIALGLGQYESTSNFGGTFMATSDYYPAPLLEELAEAVRLNSEHRQRDSITIEEGPELGISYEGLDDIVVWAGLSAIVAPDVIDGTMAIMDEYDLWGGFLFGSLPNEIVMTLRSMAGTPRLRRFAESLEPLGRGMALEAIDTYVYRTPEYQLAAAQDYKPGQWAAQTLMWRASLSHEALVMSNAPAFPGIGDLDDVTVDDPWIGGWFPRVTQYQNVAVIQYRTTPESEGIEGIVAGDAVHAYFPRDAFDEVEEGDGWHLARLGDGYLALWSQHGLAPSEEASEYELIMDGRDNVLVIEMGDAVTHGDFATFTSAIRGATIEVDDGTTRFVSPTMGEVLVGWSGPMTVDGAEIDLGPYPRWDHETTTQVRHEAILDVTLDDHVLRYDFDGVTRTLYAIE